MTDKEKRELKELLDSTPSFREMIRKGDWNTFWTGCMLAAVQNNKPKYYYANRFIEAFNEIGINYKGGSF